MCDRLLYLLHQLAAVRNNPNACCIISHHPVGYDRSEQVCLARSSGHLHHHGRALPPSFEQIVLDVLLVRTEHIGYKQLTASACHSSIECIRAEKCNILTGPRHTPHPLVIVRRDFSKHAPASLCHASTKCGTPSIHNSPKTTRSSSTER